MLFSPLNLRTCGTNQHDRQSPIEQYTKIHPSLSCNKTPVKIFLGLLRNKFSQYTKEAIKIKLFYGYKPQPVVTWRTNRRFENHRDGSQTELYCT